MFLSLQGGSFGRGTALRDGCDSESVVFLDCFESFQDLRARRVAVLEDTRPLLEAWQQDPGPGLSVQLPAQCSPGVLQFRLVSEDLENWMDVTLVPAFDVLGEGSLARCRFGGKTVTHSGPTIAQCSAPSEPRFLGCSSGAWSRQDPGKPPSSSVGAPVSRGLVLWP